MWQAISTLEYILCTIYVCLTSRQIAYIFIQITQRHKAASGADWAWSLSQGKLHINSLGNITYLYRMSKSSRQKFIDFPESSALIDFRLQMKKTKTKNSIQKLSAHTWVNKVAAILFQFSVRLTANNMRSTHTRTRIRATHRIGYAGIER